MDTAPAGGARLEGRYNANLAGRSFSVLSSSVVSAGNLAVVGGMLARLSGPASVAMMLTPLLYDEVIGLWQKPSVGLLSGDTWAPTYYWLSVISGIAPDHNERSATPQERCQSNASYERQLRDPVTSDGQVVEYGCYYQSRSNPQGWYRSSRVVRFNDCGSEGLFKTSLGMCEAVVSCPSGLLRDPVTKVCTDGYEPASPADVEGAVLSELISRGMGAELASRLISAGYEPDVLGLAEPPVYGGPTSLPGPSSTSVTSGPSGQTSTTVGTNYDIAYDGNTVTVTEVTTETTTLPDGQIQVTTETRVPAPGSNDGGTKEPSEEPKPFCELYPLASACQELGESPDQDLEDEERDLSWGLPDEVSGQCPQPRVFTSVSFGNSWEIEWEPVCQAAEAVKPVVVAFGLLSAAVFVFGIARARA